VELECGEAKCKSTNQQLNMRTILMPTAVAGPPNTKTQTAKATRKWRVIRMESGDGGWVWGIRDCESGIGDLVVLMAMASVTQDGEAM